MGSQFSVSSLRCRLAAGAVAGLMAVALTLHVPAALAQGAQGPVQGPPPPQQAEPPRPAQPGIFESIGRFFDQGAANIRSHLRSAKDRVDNLGSDAAANRREFGERAAEVGKGAAQATKSAAEATKSAVEATKSAVDAVVKLPTARVMTGRERCVTAPNGAPDCVAAAEALCRKHGFGSGKSMDFTQAEECPPRALLSARQDAQCITVTFISRAMCQ